MKKMIQQTALAVTLTLGFTGFVNADDLPNQSLGATLSATDIVRVTCSNDGGGAPHHIWFQVKDKTAGTSILGATGFRTNKSSTTTDATGGDVTSSPAVTVASGTTGVYFVMVHKTTAAARNYDLFAHCETSTNLHTGTALAVLQNQ